MTETYVAFLVAFVGPPLTALTAVRAARGRRDHVRVAGLGVLLVLALAYTTPWDNYLIARSVWWYGDGTVSGRLWLAPVEEYAFIALQTLVTGLWVQSLPDRPDPGFAPSLRHAAVGVLAAAAVGALGLAFVRTDATFYLGAILAWAAPVLALQWAVGWRYLLDRPRTVAFAVVPPTLFLATVDRYAIAEGLWTINAQYATGATVLGLPAEEGAFFLVTNLFVVQGLVLYDWVVARWG